MTVAHAVKNIIELAILREISDETFLLVIGTWEEEQKKWALADKNIT